MKHWTDREKALFNEHINKLPDEQLAALIGRPVSEIQSRRGWLKIKKENKGKFPREFKEFVRNNFRTMTNKAMTAHLKSCFPELEITPNSIRALMNNCNLKRDPADFDYIHKELVKAGAFSKPRPSCRQPGVIVYTWYRDRKRWCIKLPNGRYRPYETWLWEQHYGKVNKSKRVVIIDPSKATTIDNLQLINSSPLHQEIGEVTIRKTAKGDREYVKIGYEKWQSRETYEWTKAYGEVPKGKFARKINQELPICLENLELADKHRLDGSASTSLEDSYVISTLARGANKVIKAFITPNIIEAQRLKIQLKRLIKQVKNARNTTGAVAYNELAYPSAENDEL